MLTAPYVSPEAVYDGYPVLEALGVSVHSPHQYYVDHGVDALVALKAHTDPDGILNPGKVRRRTRSRRAGARRRRSRPASTA